jgi:hypothetical protein
LACTSSHTLTVWATFVSTYLCCHSDGSPSK